MEKVAPYIAKGRTIGPYSIDMHIEDAHAREWYDSSPDQWNRERQWCIDTILEGFTILDCGAHQGLMTTLFAKCTGPSGTVHAWEALPRNAAIISRNATLNGCENIIVHPRGVGDRHAIMPVNENQGNVILLGQIANLSSDYDVEIVRLDDDISTDLKVDFLKIDVEGHELFALRGAPRILSQRPFIMLELHNFLFENRKETVSEIVKILTDLNYYLWVDDFSKATDIGRRPDVDWLAGLTHAQVFCTPV